MRAQLLPAFVASLVLFASASLGADTPETTSIAVKTGPIIDGKRDYAVWAKTKPAGGFNALLPGREIVHKTTFRVLHDTEALYIGVRCAEENTDALKTQSVRKAAVFLDDSIEIFIAPTENRADYYQFVVNAAGTQGIYYWMEVGHIRDTSYDAVWESKTFVGEGFWSIEAAFPWHVFSRTRSRQVSAEWAFNVARNRHGGAKRTELSTWSKLKRGFHETANFGTLKGVSYDAARYDYEFVTPAIQVEPTQKGLGLTVKANLINHTGQHRNLRARCLLPAIGAETEPQDLRAMRRKTTSIEFTGLVAAKPGKYDLAIELRDSTVGRPCAVYRWPADIAFQALAIEIDQPFYRNNIYPTQEIDEIKGRLLVYLPEKKTKSAKAVIRLLKGTETLQKHETAMTSAALEFAFDAKELEAGTYAVKAELLGDGAKPLASETVAIGKLAPFAGSVTRVDRNLNLVANGRAIFPLGWYGQIYRTGSGFPFPFALSRGVNFTMGMDMDEGAANGILVVADLQPERLLAKRRSELRIKEDVEPPAFVKEAARKVIEKYRHHPALAGWYICDEPECRGVSPVWLEHYYRFVRELDPYHVAIITSRHGDLFGRTADVIIAHSYLSPREQEGRVVLNRPMSKMRRDILDVFEGGRGRTSAWTMPQAFKYARFVEDRAPDFHMERCMFYTAIAGGAKGVLPYIYHDARSQLDLRIGIDAMYETLRYLEPALLAPGPEPVSVKSPGDSVLALVKKTDQGVTIFAANMSDQPAKAKIESPALARLSQMYVVREDRMVKVARSAIEETFEGYGVHIYTTIAMLPYMDTITQINARIKREQSVGADQGNLIYMDSRVKCFDASGIMYRALPYLIDGVYDHPAWLGFKSRWLEVAFGRELTISRVVVSSVNLRDYEVQAWTDGQWKQVSAVKGNRLFRVEHRFAPTTTVKIRIAGAKTRKSAPEIAEVEVYK